eukprot:scaffold118899_cov63-Phaeocystis_antarctica.AAC.6
MLRRPHLERHVALARWQGVYPHLIRRHCLILLGCQLRQCLRHQVLPEEGIYRRALLRPHDHLRLHQARLCRQAPPCRQASPGRQAHLGCRRNVCRDRPSSAPSDHGLQPRPTQPREGRCAHYWLLCHRAARGALIARRRASREAEGLRACGGGAA